MVEIRPATDADLDPLLRIYLDAARYHAAIDPEIHSVPSAEDALVRVRGKIANPELHLFVAVDGGEILGWVEVRILEPPDQGNMIRAYPTAELGIAIREDRRGQGIGTALMRYAERWAAEHGCGRMVLDMSAANQGALRLYERLGYRIFGYYMRKNIDAGTEAGDGDLLDDR